MTPAEEFAQSLFGTSSRADRFHRDQVLDRLNFRMIEFTTRAELAFIATADGSGECDASLRAGPPGFLSVLSPRLVAYPEYRGNGVLASVGNMLDNPHVGVLLVDFARDVIGLHINGRVTVHEDEDMRAAWPTIPASVERGRQPELWVLVHVVEAYVHCRKHIPRMRPVVRDREWGSDDPLPKGGDYFGVKGCRTEVF